jgi:imidazolonepropionase-like amidohydrolase
MAPVRSLLLGGSLSLLLTSPAIADEQWRALVGATVWDGTGAEPIPDAVVLIHGDRLHAVGPRDRVRIPRSAVIEEHAGRFIMPGLIDSHVHFFQTAGLYTRPDIIDLSALRPYTTDQEHAWGKLDATFARTLASGVTAVVDVGGPFRNFDARQQARESERAPRVAVAGPLISTVSRPQLDLGDPPIIKADSPEHARSLVRAQLEQDPDLIKLWFILDPDDGIAPGLPIVQAVVHEAHAAGVRVAVHATQLETARAAVDAGADILVHSIDDAPVDQAFLDLLLEHRTLVAGTLVVYEGYAEVLGGEPDLLPVEQRLGDPWVMHSWDELALATLDDEARDENQARVARLRERQPTMAANLAAMQAAGVPVAAGTDAGNIGTLHGPSLHRELALMAEAGMDNEAVLLAATRDAARIFAEHPDFGTMEEGKLADLLILDGDPLADLTQLQHIHRVVLGGRALDPHLLVPPSPAEVVQAQVEAYRARDIEGFIATYTPDARLWRHPGGELLNQGHDAMREAYAAMFEASPELNIHIEQRTTIGEFVIDLELVSGMRGGEPVRAVAIYQVKDGLISDVWFLPKAE